MRLTDTQLLLQATARDWMATRRDRGDIRRYHADAAAADAMYTELAQLGWLGMLVPEAYGGAGASLVDAAVLFEELGRGPLPGPLYESAVLAVALLNDNGTDAQRDRWLPAIAAGTGRVAFAVCDQGIRWEADAVETTSRPDGSDGDVVLTGVKRAVLDGDVADLVVLAFREPDGDGVSLALVEGTALRSVTLAVDGFGRPMPIIDLDGIAVADGDRLGAPGSGWTVLEDALRRTLPVLCAYQVGACAELYDITVEYSRDRVVFGQAIGRFQRVQDHIIEMSIQLDGARLLTEEVLGAIVGDEEPPPLLVHQAAAVAKEAYCRVCDFAHMVFAGPGTALEHPLVPHSRIARSLFSAFGDPSHHKEQLIRYLLAA